MLFKNSFIDCSLRMTKEAQSNKIAYLTVILNFFLTAQYATEVLESLI